MDNHDGDILENITNFLRKLFIFFKENFSKTSLFNCRSYSVFHPTLNIFFIYLTPHDLFQINTLKMKGNRTVSSNLAATTTTRKYEFVTTKFVREIIRSKSVVSS